MKAKRLLVSGGSPTVETAGSIVRSYENGYTELEIRAIGASSVNQAVKAMATARNILALKGLDAIFVPAFDEVDIDGRTRTVMVFHMTIK